MDEAFKMRPILPLHMSPTTIADACRDAALAFCRGVSEGWTKRDLAAWLAGPYMAAASLVDVTVAPAIEDPPPSMRPPAMGLLDDENIAMLLDPAWQAAVTCIERLAAGDPDVLLEEAILRGSLVEALTVRGELMFVPLHRARLRLAVRVRSLLIADCMFRPQDYESAVAGCSVCGVILLGTGARERGLCGEHGRRSGIVPKESVERDERTAAPVPLDSAPRAVGDDVAEDEGPDATGCYEVRDPWSAAVASSVDDGSIDVDLGELDAAAGMRRA